MEKLKLVQYGVQEMNGMESKVTNGGISPYQNGTMIDKDGTQWLYDAVVSFFHGVWDGYNKL